MFIEILYAYICQTSDDLHWSYVIPPNKTQFEPVYTAE